MQRRVNATELHVQPDGVYHHAMAVAARALAPNATKLLRGLAARATPARIRVLEVLLGAARALTHHEIEAQLGDAVADRVTLYRVLEWLVANGLAHKTIDEARNFRFSAAGTREPHLRHAHFHCDACGRVFCLEAVRPARPRLPRGFRSSQVELSIHGACAACVRRK